MPDIVHMEPLVVRKMNELVARRKAAGRPILVTQGFRTDAEQDYDYAQGRTRPGRIITNAKGGQSFHCYGVAFDICFLKNGRAWYPQTTFKFLPEYKATWGALIADAAFLGLEHGDRGYVDFPHFQMRLGYSLLDFQKAMVDFTRFK